MKKKSMIYDMTSIAIVVALYVVLTVTPPLNGISYGGIQFRLSEMLNFLAFYNRKYIIAITIGCMISNFMNPIMSGPVDALIGGGQTLIFLSLGIFLFKRFMDNYLIKNVLNLAFFYFAIFFAFTMFMIAGELYFVLKQPFWFNWITTAAGEFIVLIIGGIIMEQLSKRIDFTR